MATYRYSEMVSVNDVYFENMDCALGFIAQEYAEWCMVKFMDTTLVSVTFERDGNVWVSYTMNDDDFADDPLREESFSVRYHELVVTVPDFMHASR